MDRKWIENFKKIQLDMLEIFIDICEEHGLKYYLIGGSCLGAVRHGGFIPWDDDIDVGMPREDYERFSAIARERLPKELFFKLLKPIRNTHTYLVRSEIPTLLILNQV